MCLLVGFLPAWFTSLAQEQFLGKTMGEVQVQLDKKRIRYTEHLSPMGDRTTLAYNEPQTTPKRTDLYVTHSLTFQQDRKGLCAQIISFPMLQKSWTADTIQNRLLASGYQKTGESQFSNRKLNSVATLEYIQDSQRPAVRMLRVVICEKPRQAE